MKPLAIDLYCGLGGWTEGLLAEGYYVVGFDIERHRYPALAIAQSDGTKVREAGVDFNNPAMGSSRNRSFNYANECAYRESPLTGEWDEYPAQLVLQDVTTLHGRQFKDAALIVASPPCQAYSYRAMPWSRAKALPPPDNTLFEACFRIQREACEAAGHFIPLVVENVRGAQKWVGRARWNFGSFYLWGDVPALMPMIVKRAQKFNPDGTAHPSGSWFAVADSKNRGAQAIKNSGGSWFAIGSPGQKETGRNPVHEAAKTGCGLVSQPEKQAATCFASQEGVKQHKSGRAWFADPDSISGSTSSKSNARKAASAMIAKIPIVLARHIAATYRPERGCND